MKRIARVGIVTALITSATLSTAVAAEIFDPLHTPAAQAPRAEQGLLIDVEQTVHRIFTAGDHGILLSQVIGDSDWQQAMIPTSVLLTAISVVDAEHIWAAGHQGALIRSLDGGESWQFMLDGHQLLDLEYEWIQEKQAALEDAIENAEDEYEIEELEFELDELFFHIGGAEIQFEVGPTKPFLDVHFFNRDVGLAVGAYGTILRTNDGGESWQVMNDAIDNITGYHINKLVEGPEQTLILVGEAGLLARSDDLGETFAMLETPYHGSLFGAIFDAQERLWVHGLRGNLYVAEDGYSFQEVMVNTRYNLNGATLLADGRLVFVGHAGVIAVVNPDSQEVELFNHPSGAPISSLVPGTGNELILVGRAGVQTFALPAASH